MLISVLILISFSDNENNYNSTPDSSPVNLVEQATSTVITTPNEDYEPLLNKSYDTLYNSRRYFDGEIKKFHDESKDMVFLWHPDQEKDQYDLTRKGQIEDAVISAGKYKIKITYLWNTDFDRESLFTHVAVTDNGRQVEVRDYKEVSLSHIYKIQVGQTFYYIFGLCAGGNHGCGILVPIVNEGNKIVIGDAIEDVDFSNYLRVEDFFTKNGQLYEVFDDQRYFGGYSGSNNASYNSAVPKIYKYNKMTANPVLLSYEFVEIYKNSTKIISDDLNKLKNNIPTQSRVTAMQTLSGRSLIPYFDYYLGMALIANKTSSIKIRKEIENLYYDFYGKEVDAEAHFDGYTDFEK